jgi:hypothetical protein
MAGHLESAKLQIDSLKTVAFTAAFLMPGFIWSALLSMLLARRSRQADTRFLEFFTLSCINNALWFWLFVYFFIVNFPARRPLLFSLSLFLALFVSPLVLGALSGHFAQRDYLARFLRRFGFRTIHYIPTAWDWHFGRLEMLWVRLTLKNGSAIYGYFGDQSFASSNPDERDIYLEKVFVPTNEGFKCVEDSHGCLLSADQITAIEFYKTQENTNVGQRTPNTG